MTQATFKYDHLVLLHPRHAPESFELCGCPCYMPVVEDGKHGLAIELGTDWIDFDDSELIGGSETLLKIWGLRASEADLANGRSEPVVQEVRQTRPLKDGVFAWFFGSVGRRVDSVSVELCGRNRVKIVMHVEDLTEESDDCNTIVTADTTLKRCIDELECPV